MFNHRTARKKIDAIAEVLEALPRLRKVQSDDGSILSHSEPEPAEAGAGTGAATETARLAEALRRGFATKKFDLSAADCRRIVVYLDLYNLLRTDNRGCAWDESVERLSAELASTFAKQFKQKVYPDEDRPV